jgi:hypothetical protein
MKRTDSRQETFGEADRRASSRLQDASSSFCVAASRADSRYIRPLCQLDDASSRSSSRRDADSRAYTLQNVHIPTRMMQLFPKVARYPPTYGAGTAG